MRLILIVAALICAAIATCIGFEIIDVERGKAVLLTVAWLSWAVVCLAGSHLPWETRFRRWFDQ